MDLQHYLRERKAMVDRALTASLGDAAIPARLAASMRYSLEAGGKRLRPILVMAGAEAVGGQAADVMPCALALEMIHTFSLIHDDLPAMDDDDLRRGLPTNHKQFDEATAILAGDGLFAEAFWLLSDPTLVASVDATTLLTVIRDIAGSSGSRGMVGGQQLDIDAEHQTLSEALVARLHAYKTGALMRVSIVSGARLAGASPEAVAQLTTYGEAIGLAFQIADDLLSIESSAEALGKPVGNDAACAKATYPAMLGTAKARAKMAALTAEAIAAVASLSGDTEPLRMIAEYVVSRSY